jgi:hypothetical protein
MYCAESQSVSWGPERKKLPDKRGQMGEVYNNTGSTATIEGARIEVRKQQTDSG